jgi:nicotinamide-nucleotide amidase
MRFECIAIGTELLNTQRVDTNSVWLAERLAVMGLAFHRKSVVGDNLDDLKTLFRESLDRSNWIICTGGLGPTFDDVTKEVWADLLGIPLVEDSAARKELEAFYAARNRVMTPNNLKQVMIPEGATKLDNPFGTAPGVLWNQPPGFPGRHIVLMPGVPREMKAMWESHIEPLLQALAGAPVMTLRAVVGSVAESALDLRIQGLLKRHGHLEWTILSSTTHVELLARGQDAASLDAAKRDLETELGLDLVCFGNGSIESTLLAMLQERQETLAVAESMTGGLIASRLTAIPGASRAFLGGVTAYSPKAKTLLADVDPAIISKDGTVSEATSIALAEGVRRRLGATWGLGITGNAGPDEDPNGPAPVGTVYVAVAGAQGSVATRLNLPGSRPDLQTRAASWAMDFQRRFMLR